MRDTSENTIEEPTIEVKLEAHKQALSAKVELLGAQPGDVIIVRPAGEAHRPWSNEASMALGEHLAKYVGAAGLLLIIPPGADIENANEEMMERHGWVRATSHTPGK